MATSRATRVSQLQTKEILILIKLLVAKVFEILLRHHHQSLAWSIDGRKLFTDIKFRFLVFYFIAFVNNVYSKYGG